MTRPSRTYSTLLNLYPERFRQRLASEMAEVFEDTVDEARQAGYMALPGLYFKEYLAIPICAAREHWAVFAAGQQGFASQLAVQPAGGNLTGKNPGGNTASKRQAFLGGLPHLLVALLVGLPQLLFAVKVIPTNIGQVFLILGAIICGSAGLAFIARGVMKRQNPTWSASWIFAIFIGILISIIRAGTLLGLDSNILASDNFTILLAVILGLMYLLYRSARANPLAGLLSALPFMLVIWSPFLEQNPAWQNPEGFVGSAWLASWLVASVAAYLSLRMMNFRLAFWLTLGTTCLAGLYHSYIGIYHGGMLPFSEPDPNPKATLLAFLPVMVTAGWIAAGPQLAARIRLLGQQCGKPGSAWYRLSLLGSVVMVTGIMINHGRTWSTVFEFPGRAAITVLLVGGGLLLCLYFFTRLILKAINKGTLRPSYRLLLLFAAIPGIPGALLLNPSLIGIYLIPESAAAWVLIAEAMLLAGGILFLLVPAANGRATS